MKLVIDFESSSKISFFVLVEASSVAIFATLLNPRCLEWALVTHATARLNLNSSLSFNSLRAKSTNSFL